MAIAARPRCRLCGHRFWPASGISNSADNERFPARNAVIGSAILLISFGIVVALVTSIPGREMLGVTLIIASWIIMAGPALGTGLIAQAVLWRTIRTRINNSTRMGTFLLLPVIVIVAGFLALTMYYRSVCVHKYNPLARASQSLAWCNLAPLPESARDVQVYTLRFLFVGKDYLRFEAAPEDIERFLDDSPGLDGITCHTYSKEKMRLATSDIRLTFSFVKKDDEHEYFYPVSRTPAWYNEEIRGKGRYFELSEGQTSWIGELIVDDEKHIVYIHKAK
ncbi:MAG: hypothetical protein JW715_10100 [Sedimentisphaerales bacterium]|nr:hypothetical protein [Sedimentisphaerales bacterium]